MGKVDMSDYIDVPERISEFRTKYPEGSLQPADPAVPYRVEVIGDRTFIVVVAAAYRNPDDKRPGIGMAYEPFPGATPFTKDSELQNAETSAWGRAIVAALAADTKRGIASKEEVRNRSAAKVPPVPSRVDAVGELVDGKTATVEDVVAICAGLAGQGAKVNDLTNEQYAELLNRLRELHQVAQVS